VVTSFTKPSAPTGSALQYTLWSAPIYFDFTQDWVQAPACGLTFTDTFVWTGLNTYAVQDSSRPGRIIVSAVALAAVGNHAVTVANTATVTANSKYTGGSSQAFAPGSDKVSFTIQIINPCLTTTLNTITISTTTSSSPYSKAVTDGSTMTVTFVRPTTAAEASNGVVSACGATSFSLHSNNSGGSHTYNAAWAVITGPTAAGVYTLTIDTTADTNLISTESTVTIPLYIKATLDDYTSQSIVSYTLMNVVVNEVTCSCSAMQWSNPTSGIDITSSVIYAGTSESVQSLTKPTQNTAARSTNAAFDKCFIGGSPPGCSSDGQVTAVTWQFGTAAATTKPSWITWPKTSGETDKNADNSQRQTQIGITPADGTVKGTHSLIVTFTPVNGSAYSYTALTFAVGCKITSWTVAGQPGSNLTYNIFSSKKILSLTGVTYTQSPACGYTFTNNFSSSTIPSGNAASIISIGTVVVPSFEIYTTTKAHEANYSLVLKNTITVGAN
jgi:hypothetical protein